MKSLYFSVTFFVFILLFVQPAFVRGQSVVINELCASNENIIRDREGKTRDWIEFFNASDSTINLLNFSITDDASDIQKWIFPGISLAPGEFLLIWASDLNRLDVTELHTNFKLSADGEFLGLFDAAGNVVDSLTFGPQTTDVSLGRKPDAGPSWMFFKTPTPRTTNNIAEESIDPPLFSHEQGYYTGTLQLELAPSGPATEIYYTLNGNLPTKNAFRYTRPIALDTTTAVRAVCINSKDQVSRVITRTYLMNIDIRLPILSLVTDRANLWDEKIGIEINFHGEGREWERPVNATYFKRDDGMEFTIDAGMRIHGETTRNRRKKSYRLYFRSEYGDSELNYKLFETKEIDEFKRLVLHMGGQDHNLSSAQWTLFRNPLMQTLHQEVQPTVSASRAFMLFLNGCLWGIYNFHERPDEYYLADNFGLADVDMIKASWKVSGEIVVGDGEHWEDTYSFFKANYLGDSLKWKIAERLIDVENFTDHNIFNIWGANWDWPQNNVYKFSSRNPRGPWRWVMWDVDAVLGRDMRARYPSWNALEWATRTEVRLDLNPSDSESLLWGTTMLRALLENNAYRIYFINRTIDLLNTTLQFNHVNHKIDSLAAGMAPDYHYEADRWGVTVEKWQANVADMKDYVTRRDHYMHDHLREKFNLGKECALTIQTNLSNAASVRINSITTKSFPWTGIFFRGLPVTLEVIPNPGFRFLGWNGTGGNSDRIVVTPDEDQELLQLKFEEIIYPPIISSISVDSIRANSAVISWKTDKPADTQVEFGLDLSYGRATEIDSQQTLTHRITLTALLPDSLYHFRCRSRATDGQLTISEDLKFTTLDSSFLHLYILSPTVENILANRAVVHWQTGRPASSSMMYGLDETYGTVLEDSVLKTKHFFALTRLEPGTRYHLQCISTDDFGITGASNNLSFVTLDSSFLRLRIASVSVDSVATTRAVIRWETERPAKSEIAFGINENLTEFTVVNSAYRTINFFQFTNLHPETEYFFQIKATDEFENEALSAIYTFRTIESSLPEIVYLALDHHSAHDARIVCHTGKPAQTKILYGLEKEFLRTQIADSGFTLEHGFYLVDLLPDTIYYFQIQAFDRDNSNDSSLVYHFHTCPQSKALNLTLQIALMPDRLGGAPEKTEWNFGRNGRVRQSIYFPDAGVYQFTACLKGRAAQNRWPLLALSLNDSTLAIQEVNSTEFEMYRFTTSLDSGEYLVSIAFTNSFADSLEVRELIGDWLQIEYLFPNGIDPAGNIDILPEAMNLVQNYPNPANPETMIQYSIHQAMRVQLKIFNSYGQEVRTLVDAVQAPGLYSVGWDARNDWGHPVVSGVYFYRLEGSTGVQIRKLIILK